MADNSNSEVLLVSGLNTDQSSFSLWNPRTGNLIKSYRSSQQQGCFCLARSGRDYVLTSEEKKQVISVWEWSKEQAQKKIVCPEKVTAMCCSPDGNYCLVALLEKIFIWQMPTGNLMKVLSRHYQTVTNIKFTDNGSHFVSAGDDNLVLVWNFSSLLSRSGDSSNGVSDEKPLHTWSNHSLPVKDIHVTAGGVRCRVATCSLDQTCKLYDLASGILLCSFLLDIGLTAVTMDLSEYFVFLGSITGRIHALHLTAMKIKKEQTIVNDSTCERFLGHSKEVTKLSVNSNGDTLVSGSADCSVKFWHIKSGQCIKQIEFKGKITNLELFRPLQDFTGRSSSRNLQPIENFKRNLYEPTPDVIGSYSSENTIQLVLKDIDKDFLRSCSCKGKTENQEGVDMALTLKLIAEKAIARNEENSEGKPKETSEMSRGELRERVDHLESLVRTLYAMNANRIMDQVASNK